MSEPLTEAERAELEALRERDELEGLRSKQAHRDFNEALRERGRAIIEGRDRGRPPGELEEWRIVRAYRRDIHGPEGGCMRVGWAGHEHAPGSMASVACRLGVSERGLYNARKRLGMKDWPPL